MLAVGALRDDTDDSQSMNDGTLYVLVIGTNASVSSYTTIGKAQLLTSDGATLTSDGEFGYFSLSVLPDLDHDGFPELAVGKRECKKTWWTMQCYGDTGAVFILYLNSNDGTYRQHHRIADDDGSMGISRLDMFGKSLAVMLARRGDYRSGPHYLLVGSPFAKAVDGRKNGKN